MGASQDDYTNTQAYQIANMNTEAGRCYSCHSPGGAGGAWWGRDNNYLTMLAKWQEAGFFTRGGAAPAPAAPPPTHQIAVASSKICAQGQEEGHRAREHPPLHC